MLTTCITRALILVVLAAPFAFAGQQQAPHPPTETSQVQLPANPVDLVRKAVANELKPSTRSTRFMFRDDKTRANGDIETKEMVDTSQDGTVVGRIIAINGKPLTPDQRDKEDKRLQRLLSDPDALKKKQQEQKEDDQRVRTMVGALPDAFTYQYAGTEQTKSGEIVNLKFTANPNFQPPSRELQVFTGMAGIMKIAVPQDRIALLQAKLFRDVTFAWGPIPLGHLDQGGQFEIQQTEVYPGYWDTTTMNVNFTGKAMIFKTLHIHEHEVTSDYHEIPSMNVAQALEMLKKMDGEVAKNGSLRGLTPGGGADDPQQQK